MIESFSLFPFQITSAVKTTSVFIRILSLMWFKQYCNYFLWNIICFVLVLKYRTVPLIRSPYIRPPNIRLQKCNSINILNISPLYIHLQRPPYKPSYVCRNTNFILEKRKKSNKFNRLQIEVFFLPHISRPFLR